MAAAASTTTANLESPILYHSLSNLKEAAIVDRIFNIDAATPPADGKPPTFLFLVGAPGAGKSSGHAQAIMKGLLPADGNYATLNVDLLLEALAPFRAASSTAHLLKSSNKTRNLTPFGSIGAYQSKSENMGLFKWYNDANTHASLAEANAATITQLNKVRNTFKNLSDVKVEKNLLELLENAIERAVEKGIHVVYETTLSLNKSNRVAKLDTIMKALPEKYVPAMIHIKAPVDLGSRVKFRQNTQMPAGNFPYYRYIPTSQLTVMAEKTAEAFEHIQKTHKRDRVLRRFQDNLFEVENPYVAPRFVATPRPFDAQLEQIVKAYSGPEAAYRTTMKNGNAKKARYALPTVEVLASEIKKNIMENLTERVAALGLDTSTAASASVGGGGAKPTALGGAGNNRSSERRHKTRRLRRTSSESRANYAAPTIKTNTAKTRRSPKIRVSSLLTRSKSKPL